MLNRRFAGLPDAAQRVYRKARDDYRAHFGQVRDALAERLARAGQDAETVRRLKERFDNELGGVYFLWRVSAIIWWWSRMRTGIVRMCPARKL